MEFGPAFSADGKLQAVGRDQQGKDSSMLNLLPFPGDFIHLHLWSNIYCSELSSTVVTTVFSFSDPCVQYHFESHR